MYNISNILYSTCWNGTCLLRSGR